MDAPGLRQALRIEIRPSPETNDHEVLFIADGVDIIARHWSGMMGLDPDDILVEPCELRGGISPLAVTIARCNCGVIGCGSVDVEIRRSQDQVVWECSDQIADLPLRLYFLATAYDAEVERALHDHSWETPDRTAARLLAALVDRDALAQNHLTFSWASGRSQAGKFTVSLTLGPGSYQVLVHVPWRGERPEEIARTLAELLEQPPDAWPEVIWYPQARDLEPPPFRGPGWQKGA